MIALLTTTDPVKLSAARALLAGMGIDAQVFDGAAGSLWTAIIPMRLMVGEADLTRARWAMRSAGFVEAKDGEWDLKVR